MDAPANTAKAILCSCWGQTIKGIQLYNFNPETSLSLSLSSHPLGALSQHIECLTFLKLPSWRDYMERLHRDRCLRSPKCCCPQPLSCSRCCQAEQRPDVPAEHCSKSRCISTVNVVFVISHYILGWLVMQH